MNKDLFIYGHEGEDAYKVDPSTVEGQVEGLSAKLQGLRDDVNAKVIYVNSVRNITVEGISVPELSEGQVVAIYNAIVNKQMVVVKSVDNSGHFVITQADALNGEISVVLIYYASALITYTTTAQGVEVSVQALGGGGGGGKVYCRKINGSFTRPVGPMDETYYYFSRSIITTNNTPWTVDQIKQGFASGTNLGNGPVIISRDQKMGPSSYSLANSISLYGSSCEIWRFNDEFFEFFEDVTSIGQYTESISEL